MKSLFYLAFCFLIFLASCRSSDKETEHEEVVYDSVVDQPDAVEPLDSSKTIVNIPSLWKVEFKEKNQHEKLEKPADNSFATLSPSQLIDALNQTYPDIHLDFKNISHDTLYVAIPESTRLTSQMGSTGAYNYLATAVYNLTEIKNVKFVNFSFKEGEHAAPGTYARDDFKKLR